MSLLVATLSAALAIASHHPVGETRIVQDPVIYRRHLKFAWSISDGKIIRGFGTKTIKVDTKNAGNTITATVEVSGLDPAANRTASCTMRIGKM
jgi:hypothetical protein